MLYAFKCPLCGYIVETPVRDPAPTCFGETSHGRMRRDYRAEAVNVDRSWSETR